MTYNDLAELFKREGGDAQVCFSVISQNRILFGNNDTNKHIISFTNEEPIKWVKEVQEESISEDLNEAAIAYNKKVNFVCAGEIPNEHFMAGANWQKQKDRKWLADNHKQIFNNGWSEGYEIGRDSMEEDMMKDAYKGYVSYIRDDSETVVYLKDSCITMPSYFPKSNLKDGDNVRILVIKDE